MSTVLDREEYVEQAYFFRTFRERIAQNLPTQDVLAMLDQEILSTTRLPMAVQFLATETRHSGLLATGFERLTHYFNPFQAFVVRQAEEETRKFAMDTALLVLEREATYRAGTPTKPGLFIYQFETIARNRLGYMDGLIAMGDDPFFDADWRAYMETVRRSVGVVDFADLVYYRSDFAVMEQRRKNSSFEPSVPMLFAEKEGKIAKASRGHDPLFLFAALQRQLNYPEVPRSVVRDDASTKLKIMEDKLRTLEARLKLLENESRNGPIDLTQFGKPDLLKDDEE
ncbi:MAG TPA: hypothetical protein VHR66_11445 [Gemmataceae bacterium]|jgi:hypothetical protein|nr:hypothetical protein [Gemmataceae bacterium]